MARPERHASLQNQGDFFGEPWQDLLQSELSIGQAVLERHVASHGRTRYFQRVRMALKALNRTRTLEVFPRLQGLIRSNTSRGAIHTNKAGVNNDDNFWSLEKDRENSREKQFLLSWASKSSIELFSRLEACVDVLLGELSRGFFVPWNVTALALVSRLWTLVRGLRAQVQWKILGQTESTSPSLVSSMKNMQQDHTAKILESLGFDFANVLDPEMKEMGNNVTDTQTTTKPSSLKSLNSQIRASTAAIATETISQFPAADDYGLVHCDKKDKADIGQSVQSLDLKQDSKQETKRLVDNETRVKEWQQSQKNLKKSKKDDRPKKKRKKDKQTKKSGDFFDNLFG